MTTQYNETTRRNEWILDRWYHKTIFVIGSIYITFWAIGFVAGVILVALEV